MRALIAIVPIALVGTYVALADRPDPGHRQSRDAILVGDVPAVVTSDARPAVTIAALTRDARVAEAQAKRAQAHAEARATVELTLDGLLRTIARELEANGVAGDAAMADLAVSATVLAELTARLDGLVQIQVQDSDHVVLAATDGAAAVRLAVER